MSASTEQPPAQRPPPPELPEPISFDVDGKCVLKYIDIRPTSHTPQTPTIVLIHGAPGSYHDFKYLVPLLQDDARVIGVTLPGFGDAEVLDSNNYYDYVVPLGGAKVLFDALAQICTGEENVFLLGHSFGGHTTIHVAALNTEDTKLNVRGIALLAAVGHRMPDSVWPISSSVLGMMIRSNLPVVSPVAKYMTRLVYTNLLRFPNNAPVNHYASGMARSTATDFELVDTHLKQIKHIPAFLAWTKNDIHISEEVSLKLSEKCHPGPRFAFDRGGHNIQKNKADILAVEILRWANEVIAG
ncbi:Serine protease family, partial [Globisporangium splendens]